MNSARGAASFPTGRSRITSTLVSARWGLDDQSLEKDDDDDDDDDDAFKLGCKLACRESLMSF